MSIFLLGNDFDTWDESDAFKAESAEFRAAFERVLPDWITTRYDFLREQREKGEASEETIGKMRGAAQRLWHVLQDQLGKLEGDATQQERYRKCAEVLIDSRTYRFDPTLGLADLEASLHPESGAPVRPEDIPTDSVAQSAREVIPPESES